MWGVSFEDKLGSIDGVVYKVSIKEVQKTEELVEDKIVAKVNGYLGEEKIFTTKEKLVRVKYVACRHSNFHHPELRILRPKLYYNTINRCQEDIDFRILANLMNTADFLEEIGIHVIIDHYFLKKKTNIYETGQPLKQQVLEDAKSREIKLPVEGVFFV